MTKSDLIAALADLPDDAEVMIDVGSDFAFIEVDFAIYLPSEIGSTEYYAPHNLILIGPNDKMVISEIVAGYEATKEQGQDGV